SSPMTAMRAPVASLRISLSASGTLFSPPGVEKRPRPSETRPEALIRSRCPLRTTRPLFVQPLFALSALTPTLMVKKVGVAGAETGDESIVRSLSGWLLLGLDGRDMGGGLFRAVLSSMVLGPLGLPLLLSNSIDSTSST